MKKRYLLLLIVYASHVSCLPIKSRLVECILNKKTISVIVVFGALALFGRYFLNKKNALQENKEPQNQKYESLLPQIEKIFADLIDINKKFTDKIDNNGKYTDTNQKPTQKEISEIRNKINTAFNDTLNIIDNKKIENKETLKNFLEELDNILIYIKDIETKINNIWHNGSCEEYNNTLRKILNDTLPNKLLQSLCIRTNNTFNKDMFTTYVGFINRKDLTYENDYEVTKKANNFFYYYQLLNKIWYNENFLNEGNALFTQANIRCLLDLPLVKSLKEECKTESTLYDKNISLLILKNIAPEPTMVLLKDKQKILLSLQKSNNLEDSTKKWFNKMSAKEEKRI
jgi:hypothetical protein